MQKNIVLIITLAITCLVGGTAYGISYPVTNDLWIRAVINTVEKGPVDAVWQKGGEDTTSRGDRVIWGHFYASPSDVTWGSLNNPDLFVKIWFDASGRIDVNYFHVSVPDIEVYTDYPYNGTANEQGTTTMSRRYIRHYFEGGMSNSEDNYEDGIPAAGYSQANNPSGYSTINNLRIGSIIETVEKGPINGVWRLGGQDTTTRGDQVVWGHFYASPSDVTWGSLNNPDLFVKIWFDAGGRIDVNYFHVSVPDIEVYSDYPDDTTYDQKGTTIMSDRYIRHEYGSGSDPSCVAGHPVFPADNIWNATIDTLPVDQNSDTYIATIGANGSIRADFGSGTWEGGPIGIPYVEVPGTQQTVPVTFDYDDESDPGPYPIPPDAPIEGGPNSDGDRHILVMDRDNCMLYELFYAFPQPNRSWHASSGAIFDLRSNDLRPVGWTSADAAGLPILPGLVRYDEVTKGEIRHALRFTIPQTRREYIWPARHFASNLTGQQYPPMGQRFRLKAGFDISGFSPEIQVILRALKRYGMFLADNGSAWFLSGTPDERWDNDILNELKQVRGSDFEAVDESSLMQNPDSGQVR
jgi:hypothetical protein